MSIPSQWRNVAELARDIANSSDLAFAKTQANLIYLMAQKELERQEPVVGNISRWQDAKEAIPHNKPASDDVMKRVKTIDGKNVFVKTHGEWIADTKNRAVKIGYSLAQHFASENGGLATHQRVAVFSLAADVDIVTVPGAKITQKEVEILTAGYEDGSDEDKAQKKLGERFPVIVQAILSFF